MRNVGTIARGIRAPIIQPGDNLVRIVADSLDKACASEGFSLCDRDVVAVTEAVLARAQNNFASIDQISADIKSKFPGDVLGVVFPIMSRNRFSLLLQAIARGVKKLVVQLSFPADEVGNPLITWDQIDEAGIDPYKDVFTENRFREIFGELCHPFTMMDYPEYYRSLGDNIEIIFANHPLAILKYTNQALAADIHSRKRTKRRLAAAGAHVLGLDDILTSPAGGSGYNPQYGLLGSNLATENSVKLFPRDGDIFVHALQKEIRGRFGKHVEVMIYGDGAFKDPVGGIWELADPVVAPAFTGGLAGRPNELKLKYIVDNQLKDVSGDEAAAAVRDMILGKDDTTAQQMASQGTTPRQYSDLLGTLSDLTSGSGDKGTPIVLIQGYFDNYAS